MKKPKKTDVLKEIREARKKMSVEFFNNPEKMLETLNTVYEKRLRREEEDRKSAIRV